MLRLAVLFALLAQPALAQSQLARGVVPDLRRAGVSEACIARLSEHDFAALKAIQDTNDRSSGWVLQHLKFQAERRCGDTRSFVFELFD